MPSDKPVLIRIMTLHRAGPKRLSKIVISKGEGCMITFITFDITTQSKLCSVKLGHTGFISASWLLKGVRLVIPFITKIFAFKCKVSSQHNFNLVRLWFTWNIHDFDVDSINVISLTHDNSEIWLTANMKSRVHQTMGNVHQVYVFWSFVYIYECGPNVYRVIFNS